MSQTFVRLVLALGVLTVLFFYCLLGADTVSAQSSLDKRYEDEWKSGGAGDLATPSESGGHAETSLSKQTIGRSRVEFLPHLP